MRHRLALAILALSIPATAAGLAACGGDDSSSTPGSDAGADATTKDASATDASKLDAQPGSDSSVDAGDAGAQQSLFLMNNLIPVTSGIRVCLLASATDANPGLTDAVAMSPVPSAALGPGDLATVQVPALTGENVRVVAYYQSSLTALNMATASCQQLLAVSALLPASTDGGVSDGGDAGDAGAIDSGIPANAVFVQTADFDVFPTIASSAVSSTAKHLLVVTGCPQSSDLNNLGDPYYCGVPDSNGNSPYLGDLHALAFELSSVAGDAGTANVQGLWMSQGYAYIAPTLNLPAIDLGVGYTGYDAGSDAEAPPGYLLNPGDGGVGFEVPTTSGALAPATVLPSLTTANNGFYFVPDRYLNQFDLGASLAGSGLTTADLSGGAFTLIVYGDAQQNTQLDDGGANPLFGIHLIRTDTP